MKHHKTTNEQRFTLKHGLWYDESGNLLQPVAQDRMNDLLDKSGHREKRVKLEMCELDRLQGEANHG